MYKLSLLMICLCFLQACHIFPRVSIDTSHLPDSKLSQVISEHYPINNQVDLFRHVLKKEREQHPVEIPLKTIAENVGMSCDLYECIYRGVILGKMGILGYPEQQWQTTYLLKLNLQQGLDSLNLQVMKVDL